jgi:HPt (histidine-containing phosphotransfer) domain-containing protein
MASTQQTHSARTGTGVAESDSHLAAIWNRQELMERLDNDQDFLRELLGIFRIDSVANLQNAKSAMEGGDMPGLMRSAHTLKGMLRNLSMNHAAEIAHVLEIQAREEKGEEAAASLVQLADALAELAPQVDVQLSEVKV